MHLATGDESATSTNDTYSENAVFERGDIRLDYAYAETEFAGSYSLILGQQINPIVSSGILWDSDVRPVGLTLKYTDEAFFFTAGAYDVIHIGNDVDNTFLFTLQGGYKNDKYLWAVTYYHFTNDLTSPLSSSVSGLPTDIDDRLEFRILSLYNELNFKVDDFKFKLFSEFAVNIHDNSGINQNGENESSESDFFTTLGGSAYFSNLKLKYNYVYIEPNSIYGGFKDSDFVTANYTTNVKGHKLGLEYSLSKNLTLGSTFYFVDEIDNSECLKQLELDVVYKF